MEAANDSIRFILNGKLLTADNAHFGQSVLSYLRQNLHLTGTKEGCAEGDCGACTVVLAELNNDNLSLRPINACMQFVPTLAGKALFTVEGLKQTSGDPHPVQQAMINCHGSQCGFCTPGFIMSLWSLYLQHCNKDSQPDQQTIRTALSGNLCRCTGYKPILAAAKQMFDLPMVKFDSLELISSLEALQDKSDKPSSQYRYKNTCFYIPHTLSALLQLRTEHPQATLLAGSTDISLWVNKQLQTLDSIIYLGEVKELKQIATVGQYMHIGAAVSLEDAYAALYKYYPQLQELWQRFASPPIRNIGTLCGNVANGSPIGDSMPWLLAVNAKVIISNQQQQRTIALEELYIDYMQKSLQADEIIQALAIPLPDAEHIFRTYKISKRYDSDISAVCAGFFLQLKQNKISTARIAYGGMAAIPKRALHCEQALTNKPWCEANARNAMHALQDDYSPLSDARASRENRYQSAQNLLYRFYLETRLDNPLPADQQSVFAH